MTLYTRSRMIPWLQVLRLLGFIAQSEPQETQRGYLRGFESLETVEIEASLLLGSLEWGRHSLADELPRSIKSVSLHGDMFRDGISYCELLDELLKTKKERLPNLQALEIIGLGDSFDKSSTSHYKASLKSVGVDLTLKREYDYIN